MFIYVISLNCFKWSSFDFFILVYVTELLLDWFLMKDIGKDVVKHDGKFVISTRMETVGRGCTLKGI